MPKGGAATGFGGTAPAPGPGLLPWLGTLAGGLLLAAAGVFGLRRSRRSATAHDWHPVNRSRDSMDVPCSAEEIR